MPRTSEKAQLTSQLQETWLAHVLWNMIFDNDLKLLRQFLGLHPKFTFRQKSDSIHRQNPNYSGLLDEGGGADSDEGLLKGLWIDMPLGPFGLEESENREIEVEEFVGFLGIAIEGMRYLAPRMPIPRSEYLFRHHVC